MALKRNGFTLVELVIALGVGALIITVIYAAMNAAQKSSASVGRKVVTQQDARTVLDIMTMEIRMASYNPGMTKATWTMAKDGNCKEITLTPDHKGIQKAAANEIAIAMDLDNSKSIANSASDNEYIVYRCENETIRRSVSCGNFQPMLGGTDTETNVRNASAKLPLFQYFDRDGNNLADASGDVPAALIPSIRRVRINIVADTKNPDSMTQKVRRMTYTTDVLVKNHVLCP